MINCIIVEDEIRFSNTLVGYIEKIPQLNLLGVFKSVQESIVNIELLNPDLLFLDIELKDGQSFEILNHFSDKQFQVIFTTGYYDYAIKAIKHSAIDYLLKPVNELDFSKAVKKAIQFHGNKLNAQKVELMLSNLQKNEFSKIAIHSIDGIEFIDKEDILFCEAEVSYTTFFLEGNKKLVSSNNIKKIESILSEKNFFRLHKSFIVNINKIKKVYKTDGGYVEMPNGYKIPIARRRKEEFMNLLGL